MKHLILLGLIAGLTFNGYSQVNLGKLKNKAKTAVNKNKKEDSKKPPATVEKKESPTKVQSTAKKETVPTNNALSELSAYYKSTHSYIDRNLSNIANRDWDHDFLDYIETLDLATLEQKMKEDESKCGEFLMLYPKKLPTSGMGTITQNNVSDYTFARVAGANEEPPSGEDGKKIMLFYKEYCLFKHDLLKGEQSISNMLRRSIQETESAHIRQKFKMAQLSKRQGEFAVSLLPESERIQELKEDADRLYIATVEGFGNMLSGDYHKTHLLEISVFNTAPKFGSESSSQEVNVIIPGETAYITGYFAMTNKDAGGIPSLLFIDPEDKYAKDKNPWGHGTEILAPMFNGTDVKAEFYDKAYFTFNLFPDINAVDYTSHVQYIPHLNILKWLSYLPSKVVEIPVRYGRNEKVALGKITVDLSGENKTKLKAYIKQLEAKRLASVTFPDLSGCAEKRSSVRNFDDLAKYGKVLKLSLSQTGDIMKPWPKDDEVDFNTAAGFAAVQLSSGKIEIMPLDFRKRPTETSWQWWSVGSFPNLYPMNDNGTPIVAVKKIIHGYEILPQNVSKCGYWYTNR